MTANFASFITKSSSPLDGLFEEVGNKVDFAVMRRLKKIKTNQKKNNKNKI